MVTFSSISHWTKIDLNFETILIFLKSLMSDKSHNTNRWPCTRYVNVYKFSRLDSQSSRWAISGCVRLAPLGRPRCVTDFFPRTNVGNYLHTFNLENKLPHTGVDPGKLTNAPNITSVICIVTSPLCLAIKIDSHLRSVLYLFVKSSPDEVDFSHKAQRPFSYNEAKFKDNLEATTAVHATAPLS